MSLETDALFEGTFFIVTPSLHETRLTLGQIFIGQFMVDNKSLESEVN